MSGGRQAPSNNRFRLDRASREIVRDGRRLRLAEKPFRVLEALIDAHGQVVTRETLRRLLWSEDTFVDFDNNLNSAVATLRQVLGDSARTPRFIETLPKVGYRFIASDAMESDGARANGPRPAGRPWWPAVAGVGCMLAISLAAAIVVHNERPILATSPVEAAQSAYERGRYLRRQHADRMEVRAADLEAARDAFRTASAHDPAFSAAVAEEADTLVDLAFAGARPFRSALEEARAAARRAMTIDPASAVAERVLAAAELFLDWNFASAGRRLARAGRLAPADARTALARAMYLSARGRHDAALAQARRAVALDPESYFVRADLAFFCLAGGRNEEAARVSRDVLAAAPSFAPAQTYALTANERLGRWDVAARLARQLMQAAGAAADDLAALESLDARAAVAAWRRWDMARAEARAAGREGDYALDLALRHAALGDHAQALDQLERAFARRQAMLVFLRAYPELAPLRGTPRFEKLAARLEGRPS